MPGDNGDGTRDHQIDYLLTELRRIAAYYLDVRGCALSLTNEVGELEAELQLGLSMVNARGAGHDAVDKGGARLCIRSRVVTDVAEPGPICINGLKIRGAWDGVVLVLLDQQYELLSIYRAERADLERAIGLSRNRKKSERPAFSINTFVKCGRMVWPTD